MDAPLENVWRLTQSPELHQRRDLRFTEIEDRVAESEPQQFLYARRIGFGMSIAGTGESVGGRLGRGRRSNFFAPLSFR
jgi:hypothetical protein